MIFLRNFYDENRRVNTKHRWVWIFHLFSYMYIIYAYYLTGDRLIDASESSKIWIPLDIILTFNIALYQIFYNHMQYLEDQENAETTGSGSPSGVTPLPDIVGDTKETPLLDNEEKNGAETERTAAKKKGFSSIYKKKKVELDSIYNVSEPKVTTFKLTADSTSMGFGVFLKQEFLGLNLSAEQQSDVFMNSLIV